MSNNEKQCCTCKEIKELSEFGKNKSTKDGLQKYCIECGKISARKHRRKYPDKKREYAQKDRAKNPEKYKQRRKANYDKNKEKELAYGRKHYYETIEYQKIKERKWRTENPEKNRIKSARRRTKKQKLLSDFNAADWFYAVKYFNNCCAYCGEFFEKLTQDHIVPISSNGHYIPANIVPVCEFCNSSKYNYSLLIWTKKKFGKEKAEEIVMNIRIFMTTVRQVNVYFF